MGTRERGVTFTEFVVSDFDLGHLSLSQSSLSATLDICLLHEALQVKHLFVHAISSFEPSCSHDFLVRHMQDILYARHAGFRVMVVRDVTYALNFHHLLQCGSFSALQCFNFSRRRSTRSSEQSKP